MEKIGLFYSFRSTKTKQQASRMVKALGEDVVELVDLDTVDAATFLKFSNYILAVPTWFDGELPNYWDEFIPAIEDESFTGKSFAIFGGGDQKGYPENFVDGIGIMAEFIEERSGKVVGHTSTDGYKFESSRACRGNEFVGFALDIENQAALTHERIDAWIEKLKTEFN